MNLIKTTLQNRTPISHEFVTAVTAITGERANKAMRRVVVYLTHSEWSREYSHLRGVSIRAVTKDKQFAFVRGVPADPDATGFVHCYLVAYAWRDNYDDMSVNEEAFDNRVTFAFEDFDLFFNGDDNELLALVKHEGVIS